MIIRNLQTLIQFQVIINLYNYINRNILQDVYFGICVISESISL